MMKLFEYHRETLSDLVLEARLNDMGLQGWQLVTLRAAPALTGHSPRVTIILERVIIQDKPKTDENIPT